MSVVAFPINFVPSPVSLPLPFRGTSAFLFYCFESFSCGTLFSAMFE